MGRIGITICMVLCLCPCLRAQIRIVPAEKLESVTAPKLSDNAVSVRFGHTFVNAGRMGEDDGVRTYEYPFTNLGSSTIVIDRMVSTCSCVSASCGRMSLQPGESSTIVLRHDPKGHVGRFERKVFIYVNGDDAPVSVLRLSVDVERGKDFSGHFPVEMGNIRLRRSEIVVKKGSAAVERCAFVNVGNGPLKVECERAMLPECLSFKTEPEVVQAGEEGDIVIHYDPSKGGARDKIPVLLKRLGLPPSQSTLWVRLQDF